MASNSVQPVQPVQQMPQAAQPQHMPNEPQVREFLVDHIGYANPNDDRLEELAEMGVDAEMYDRSIELARQPLALHDRAHTDILDRVVNNIATLRGRLDAMLGGQAGLLIWFLGLYTMTRRWFELHAQVGHGTTRLTFSHYDTLNIDDVQPVNWLFVIRQWLDCIIHSYALGRRALECPELRRYMEETSYLLVGDEADQPDGTYQPDNLVAEAAASVSHMRIAFDRTNNLLDLCLNPNVQSVNVRIPSGPSSNSNRPTLRMWRRGTERLPAASRSICVCLCWPSDR